MPSIPRASDINRLVPDVQQRVTTAGTGGLENSLSNVGTALGNFAERKIQYQVSQAKAEFLTAKVQEDNAYNDDQDYETIGDRYSTNVKNAAQSAAEKISFGPARNAFLQDADLDIEQGFQRIRGVAKAKETDTQRAFISESLDGLREATLTGDPMSAMDSAMGLIKNGADMGYLSHEEAAKLFDGWRDDALIAKIETMEPEDRVEALSQPWAKELPTDVQTKLGRIAKDELDKNVAMENVDSYFQEGLEPTEAYTRIGDIEDPDVRRETEQRFTTEVGRRRGADAALQEDLHRAFFNPVRAGELSVSDIPQQELDRMDPAVVNSLYAAERNAATKIDPVTDRAVLDTLYQKYQDGHGDPVDVRNYFAENAHRLSNSDFEQWSKVTSTDFEGLEGDPVFTGSQMIQNKLYEVHGYGDTDERNEAQAKYRREFEQYVFDYRKQNNGNDPSGQEQRDYIDRMMLRLPTRESRIPLNTTPAGFQEWGAMDQDTKAATLAYVRSQDPEAYQSAIDIASNGGTTIPDPDDVAYLFSIISEIDDAP